MSEGVVRELTARFGFEVDKSSATQLDAVMDGIIGKFKALAAIATLYKVADFVAGIVHEADGLNDAAERIGTTTEALQGLGYAADISGSSADSMMQGVKFLTKTIGEASGGSKEATAAFHALGVSFKNSDGSLKTATDLFPEIADALNKVENPTKRAALSIGVFSRAGQDLQPFLAKGSENIRNLTDEFKALGGVYAQDFVQMSAEAVDNNDRLTAALKGVGQALGKAVLPSINAITGKMLEWWKIHGQRVREVLGYITTAIAKVVEWSIQLLAPWINLALVIADGWAQLVEFIAGVEGLLPILAILAILALAFWAPWIAGGALIALIAEDIYQFCTGGESVLGDFVDMVKGLFDSLVQGVLDAVDEAIKTVIGLGDQIYQSFIAAFDGIKAAFREMVGGFGSIGSGIGGAFSEIGRTLGLSGSSTVTPSSTSGGPSISNSSSTQMAISVHAAPGMDEAALANHVAEQVRQIQADQNLQTYNAVIGAAR